MIDLHCHVLPGIDDGPETMDGAIELARAAEAQGTSVLVATPHVTYDHLHNTSERILTSVEEVNRALRKQRIDVMVLPGAEVALERAGELDDEEIAALRLGGGPWLLVECPMFAGGMGVDGQLHALASRGNKIVLAHPERCPVFQTDLTRVITGYAESSGATKRHSSSWSRRLSANTLPSTTAPSMAFAVGRGSCRSSSTV